MSDPCNIVHFAVDHLRYGLCVCYMFMYVGFFSATGVSLYLGEQKWYELLLYNTVHL